MIKIQDILKEYNLSKKDLLSLVEKVTWKKYSGKVTRLWDSTFEKIKPFLEKQKKVILITKLKKNT